MKMFRMTAVLFSAVAAGAVFGGGHSPAGFVRRLELPPGPGNPRNSEGAFARLKDGSILFAYTRFTGTSAADNGTAHIASRVSRDGGISWSRSDKTEIMFDGDGENIMSVSFLRLKSGALAIFYAKKNSQGDCRPVMRVSGDEAASWGTMRYCVPDSDRAYYTLNNDRAVRLKTGRIVLPLARFKTLKDGAGWDESGEILCALSDDDGQNWRLGKAIRGFAPDGRRVRMQEPGAIEMKSGRLLVWARTDDGRQYRMFSDDGGETLSAAKPWNLLSPLSPASVKRLSDGRLIALWNDHGRHPEYAKGSKAIPPRYRRVSQWGNGHRAPLTIAVSFDDGEIWSDCIDLETDPEGFYCYTAVLEEGKRLLLGYCARDELAHSRISTFDLSGLPAPGSF